MQRARSFLALSALLVIPLGFLAPGDAFIELCQLVARQS